MQTLDGLAKSIAKEKQTFERLVLTKAQLKEMFKYNVFKACLI